MTNFAYSARFAGAWLVLAALTVTLGLQLLAQLREFRTVIRWPQRSVSKRHRGPA